MAPSTESFGACQPWGRAIRATVAGKEKGDRRTGPPDLFRPEGSDLVARARPVGEFHAAVLHFADTVCGLNAQVSGVFAERLGGHHALGDRVSAEIALHRVRTTLRET